MMEEGYVMMIMYAKIIHQKAWKELKDSEAVMLYLRQNRVFMCIDQFNTRKVGTPGFVTKNHPKIHNMKKLRGAIEYGLKAVDCHKEETVRKWQDRSSAERILAEVKDEEKLARIKDQEENIIPTFVMYTGSKKWGPHHDRVDAYVVNIQCAAEDAPYMKTLLSAAYEQQPINIKSFVPQGLFQIIREEAYKYHLQAHNNYIISTMSVAIVGMHQDAMEAKKS
eukprot:15367097-Ditylum_brightwellii.AAC.2